MKTVEKRILLDDFLLELLPKNTDDYVFNVCRSTMWGLYRRIPRIRNYFIIENNETYINNPYKFLDEIYVLKQAKQLQSKYI